MGKIVREVRSAFNSTDEITFTSVSRLQHSTAVREESIRLYPPTPFMIHSVPPRGGGHLMGQCIPE